MTWDDLRKFTTQHKLGDRRPAAYVANAKHGDLIVLGPTHESIREYLEAHPEEGAEKPVYLDIFRITKLFDGDEFDKNGGRLTMI